MSIPVSAKVLDHEVLNWQIEVPHPSYIEGGHPISVWFLLAVFVFFYSLAYVLARRLPFFWTGKKHEEGNLISSPLKAFSLAFALIVIFGSDTAERLAVWMYNGGQLIMIALSVMFILILWWLVSGSYHSGRAVSKELEAESHKQGANARQARALETRAHKEEHMAKEELKKQDQIFRKQDTDLANADHALHSFQVDTRNHVRTLEDIAQILHHLVGIQTPEEAVKLKQAYKKQLAALSTIVAHEDTDLDHFNRIIHEIRALGHHTMRDVQNEIDIVRNLNREYQRMHNAAVPATKVHHAQTLANRAHRFNAEKQVLITALQGESGTVSNLDKQANEKIRQVIHNVHNDNFPAALTDINEAIAIKKNIDHQTHRMTGQDRRLEHLQREAEHINREIEQYLRRL